MARNIKTIYQELIDAKEQEEALNGLTSTSKTAIWSLLFYIVAACAWTLERLFDEHKTEVTTIVEELKPHTLSWYVTQALNFQNGGIIDHDTYTYNNEGLSEAQVEAQKIIKSATASEVTDTASSIPVVYLKVAKHNSDGVNVPLSEQENNNFQSYIGKIKDAGVTVRVISRQGCGIKMDVTIYYDATVMNSDGTLIADGSTPVVDTIKNYLQNLPFDSEFRATDLVDALQAVAGVVMPYADNIAFDDANNDTWVAGNYFTPTAGYFEYNENNIDINYTPHATARN